MQSKAKTVAAYLAEQPPERQAELARLRELICEAAPAAEECMRYGMPAYEIGELLFSFAAQKNYFAFYLLDTKLVEHYRAQLGKLSVGKGCIRFRKFDDLPAEVLRQMLVEAVWRRTAGITAAPCDDAGGPT
jgi:uncharacterized protein YdhG (YjbR/CyaY superfamily)